MSKFEKFSPAQTELLLNLIWSQFADHRALRGLVRRGFVETSPLLDPDGVAPGRTRIALTASGCWQAISIMLDQHESKP